MFLMARLSSAGLRSTLTLSAALLLNMQMFPALQDRSNDEAGAGSDQTETWNLRHLQDDEGGCPRKNVESSSAAVNRGCLLLVHLPTTVATAATASQE